MDKILGSSVIVAMIAFISSLIMSSKQNRLQYITAERKEWRERIRSIEKRLGTSSYKETLQIINELKGIGIGIDESKWFTNLSKVGNIASAAIFAIVHANPAQMPHALLIGILLGWLYCRTGSILPGVAVHWVNNTAAYVFERLFPQMSDTTLTEFFGGDESRVLLSVAFSLLILLPAIYQLYLRTGDEKR